VEAAGIDIDSPVMRDELARADSKEMSRRWWRP
jgi:hypothetical protein